MLAARNNPPWQDFKARISKYESVYETIMDRTIHYIKLIDMVTGASWGRHEQ